MFDWNEYQVSETLRQQLLEQAARQRQLSRISNEEVGIVRALRWLGNVVGAWMVELGTSMQTCSDEVAESLQYAKVGASATMTKRAEQNC